MRACLILLVAVIPVCAMGGEYRLVWSETYDSSAHSHDASQDVAVTSDGEILVAGYERREDMAASYDILIKKYNPSGGLIWTRTYNRLADGDDRANGIAVGPGGSVYAAGFAADLTTTSTGWLRKYDANGSVLWTATFTGVIAGRSLFEGVAVDASSGEAYVAGGFRTDSAQGWNCLLAKYSSGGALIWSLTYNGAANENDRLHDVTIDRDGNVLVTGYCAVRKSSQNVYDYNILIQKYTPGGNLIWFKTYGSEIKSDQYRKDYGYGIATDESGDVYVVGTVYGGEIGGVVTQDRWARKYSADGSQSFWTIQINIEWKNDYGLDCAIGRDGSLYLSGWSFTPAEYEGKNLTVERISCLSGQIIQTINYDAERSTVASVNVDEMGLGVAAYGNAGLVVVGMEDREDLGQGFNWVVQRYEAIPDPPPARANIRVYPNPFRPSQAINGEMKFIRLPAMAVVEIYTIGGRLIRVLPEQGNCARWDGKNSSGERMGTGAYFYVIRLPGASPVKGKLVIVKE